MHQSNDGSGRSAIMVLHRTAGSVIFGDPQGEFALLRRPSPAVPAAWTKLELGWENTG
jgi:hypothetical protein